MTSPSSSRARETARSDLPDPVGPTTAITGGAAGCAPGTAVVWVVSWRTVSCWAAVWIASFRGAPCGPGTALTAADREAGHAQRHAGGARRAGLARGANLARRASAAGICLGTVPGIAGTGPAQAVVLGRGGVGDEMERRRLRDGDGHQIAWPWHFGSGGHREVHQPLVLGPAGEAVGFPSLAARLGRHHDLDAAAKLPGVFLGGNPVLQGSEALEAFLDHGLGQLVRQVRGGRARPLGVLEGEGGGEPGLLHDVEGGLEVLLGLAGEPDDDVRGDGGVRD